jgi:hypothetical protein
MAVGQLADCARLVDPPPKRAILVAEKPRDDLLRLAESENIAVVWIVGEGEMTSTEATALGIAKP